MRNARFLLVATLMAGAANGAVLQYAKRATALMDLELPTGDGPFPVFIAVHGGGWESGSRSDALPFCRVVVAAGFACAAIDYRLAPAFRLPAQLEDVRDALAFLRSNSHRLRLRTDRIILAGESAGGHLAALTAVQTVGGGIAGVAAFSTPFDLETLAAPGQPLHVVPDQMAKVLGIAGWSPDSMARLRAASPMLLLTGNSPPFLVIRGSDDQLVPAGQAQAFCERAGSLAVPCSLVTVSGAKHLLWGETEVGRFEAQWHDQLLHWARTLGTAPQGVPMAGH